jgi:5-methylcytosine-specific restriction endonuclease McrA
MRKDSKMSEESRERCRAGQLRRAPKSQATRDKISASHIGIGHTEETREKLKQATIRQFKLRPHESVYHTLLCNARRRNLEVTLTFEEFLDIIKVGECFYCGAHLYWPEYNAKKTSQASNLDRKDNTKGYLSGNVVACCWSCNNIKREHFTFEQFVEIGKLLRSWKFPGSQKGLPEYLNCVFCPAQAFLQKQGLSSKFAKYRCYSRHEFYIDIAEDTSFNYGYNYDKEEACTLMNTKDEH